MRYSSYPVLSYSSYSLISTTHPTLFLLFRKERDPIAKFVPKKTFVTWRSQDDQQRTTVIERESYKMAQKKLFPLDIPYLFKATKHSNNGWINITNYVEIYVF